jgi:hypothetical protein
MTCEVALERWETVAGCAVEFALYRVMKAQMDYYYYYY